ncbi:lysophospholipid acyltransferase family protein [Sneathiella glossodoripedis]|uniref:lysophospholipid acyltransferase family protein n=1 Tax=Sneathiella glossodoripedis TaxID=418853 RepID=UPI00046EA26A|nr:lysophospholipid acyltransferase family protein [Sneathiella glossodoripedis]
MLRKLDWFWRLLVTGFAFSLFGLGGLFMTIFYFPILKIIIRDKDRKANVVQATIHRSFGYYLSIIEFIGVCDITVENKEYLKGVKGTVIIANHPSLLDTVILMGQMNRAQCIVKHELWNNFFLGGVMRAANYIRNDEDPEKLIRDCVNVLERGDNLIVFPEGTRTPPGSVLGKLQRGVANIIVSSTAPILPVTIHCNHRTLAKGEPWYRIPPTRLAFTIRFSKQCESVDLVTEKTEHHSLNTRRMTAAIKHLLETNILGEEVVQRN